jgi:hypothetical protein
MVLFAYLQAGIIELAATDQLTRLRRDWHAAAL